ncbi:hypothetical protein Fmac_008619 [Flemingia macrophylla]|uniref:Uncharacterized protein n=1 Tax=Flemingia macrophylla TaxID=520843 RepID=A0ABD1MY06_9FABA
MVVARVIRRYGVSGPQNWTNSCSGPHWFLPSHPDVLTSFKTGDSELLNDIRLLSASERITASERIASSSTPRSASLPL